MGLFSQFLNLLFLSRFLLLQVYQPDILLLFFPLKNLVFLILYIVKIVAFLPFFLSSLFQSFFSRSFHPADFITICHFFSQIQISFSFILTHFIHLIFHRLSIWISFNRIVNFFPIFCCK